MYVPRFLTDTTLTYNDIITLHVHERGKVIGVGVHIDTDIYIYIHYSYMFVDQK